MSMASSSSSSSSSAPSKEMPDYSRWVVVYPAYVDAGKSVQEGRRVPKEKAIKNPIAPLLAEGCGRLGFVVVLENNKKYCRDFLQPGRLRVKLFDEQKKPINPEIPSRKALFLKIAEVSQQIHTDALQQHQQRQSQQSGVAKNPAPKINKNPAMVNPNPGSGGAKDKKKKGKR